MDIQYLKAEKIQCYGSIRYFFRIFDIFYFLNRVYMIVEITNFWAVFVLPHHEETNSDLC